MYVKCAWESSPFYMLNKLKSDKKRERERDTRERKCVYAFRQRRVYVTPSSNFFAFQLPSSSTSEKRLHPLIESMLPDERYARRVPPYFPLYPAAFHRGCSPRLEGGYRGCRLCPTGVKIKAAISQSAQEAVFYGGGLLWNCTPILDGFAPSFYNPVANHKRPPDTVRVAASYPPPTQTRLRALNEISRVESITKIAIRDTFF